MLVPSKTKKVSASEEVALHDGGPLASFGRIRTNILELDILILKYASVKSLRKLNAGLFFMY